MSFRIAIAQINTALGDFSGNRKKIIEYIQRSHQKHCDLVVFPESTIFGYHPFDLLERADLVEKQLKELRVIEKAIPKGMAALIGVITKNPNKKGRPYFNSAALLEKGKKPKFFHKELLPTGDVFDEARFIESGRMKDNFFIFKKKKIFLTICEDIWAWPKKDGQSDYQTNPLLAVKPKKLDLVINMSASPFYPGKLKIRQELVKKTAALLKAPMIYANLVGAQDEIIFDGMSFACDRNGKLLLNCVAFEEDLNVLDLDKMEGGSRPKLSDIELLRQALVLGIRDFCHKTGLNQAHLGLSGGVDSALVACLLVDALGPSKVTAFALPTEFNSAESLSLAKTLAGNLGIHFEEIAIQESFLSLRKTIDKALKISDFGLVHENLQARLRGMILMAFSNLKNSLLIATCNKSELAAGYSTLYGDVCGGLAPIGDLTKAQVYQLCEAYNLGEEIIPKRILGREPTAELRPNQKDQDSLPPYSELDQSVVRLVENCASVRTTTDQWLFEAIMKSEFKRWQGPPILKVSKHSFGRGRRYPVAQRILKQT
jgi:NAD+ synthase (glutamine-hydrolysing)